jgi:hypothetical protein
LKCCLRYAFINVERITRDDANLAYFVLQAPLDGPCPAHLICVNRFLREEDARSYFATYWSYSFGKENSKHSYALLVRKGEVLAKFGYADRLERLENDLNSEDADYEKYKRITGMKLEESETINQYAVMAITENDRKTLMLTCMNQ